MSSGLNCDIISLTTGEWFYILEDYNAPRSAWDWRDYASAYGPFTSREEAEEHLRRNHSNPGGYDVEENINLASCHKDSPLPRLIEGARAETLREAARRPGYGGLRR